MRYRCLNTGRKGSAETRHEHIFLNMTKTRTSGISYSFYTQAIHLFHRFLMSHNYVLLKAVGVICVRTRHTYCHLLHFTCGSLITKCGISAAWN